MKIKNQNEIEIKIQSIIHTIHTIKVINLFHILLLRSLD